MNNFKKISIISSIFIVGLLLMTGCSSTKEIGANQNLNTNSTGYITSFDLFKTAGNRIDYQIMSYNSIGNIFSVDTSNITTVTTDYVSSNAVVNHSVHIKINSFGSITDQYVIQTSTEVYAYRQSTNQMEPRIQFPLNQTTGNIIVYGQEIIPTVFGNISCFKIKETFSDGYYLIAWAHQKYYSLKEEYYTSQNFKIFERHITGINF